MALDIAGFDEFVEIGRGGFGVVYRAEQTALGRTVAVKVLAVGEVDPEALRRFEREGRILGQLSEHPNIVTVHDSGTTPDGRPWVAMAYLPAGSLADRLRTEGPLSAEEVASIGVRIGGALETAHRAGILHRDVKPENILLTSYGEPSLADFGIARMAGGTQTVAGAVTASLAHAPPEILDGTPPTPAGDVYALASTLFTLLHGRPAFDPGPDGAVSQLIAGIVSRPVPDLRPLGVADPLAEAIELGMARDLDSRPATAADFVEVLRRAQRDAGWTVTEAVMLDPAGVAPAAAPTGPVDPDDVTRVHSASDLAVGDTLSSPAVATPLDDEPRAGVTAASAAGPGSATPPDQTTSTGPADDASRAAPVTDPSNGGDLPPVDSPGQASPPPATRPEGGPGKWPLVVGGLAAAVVIGVGAVALSGGGDDPADPGDTAAASPSPDDGDATPDTTTGTGMPTPLFTEGPNDGEGRVLFRVELDAMPLEAVTDGEALYVATENSIEARTLEDGIRIWAVNRSQPGPEPVGLGLGEGLVWFSDGGEAVGLAAASGSEAVRVTVDGAPTRTVVTHQGMVLGVAGPTIQRFDAQGQVQWSASAPLAQGEQYAFHPHTDEPILVTTDTQIIALDPASGDRLYTATLPDHEVLHLAQGNARVVIAAATEERLQMIALNHVTGEVAWEANRAAPDVDGVRLEIEDGIVILADGESLVGIDSNSGAPDWERPFPVGDDSSIGVGIGQVVAIGDPDGGSQLSTLSAYSGDPSCATISTTEPEWPVLLTGRWEWMDTEGTYVSLDGVYDGPEPETPCQIAWVYDLPLDANAVMPPVYAHDLGYTYVLDDNWWLTGLRLWEQ